MSTMSTDNGKSLQQKKSYSWKRSKLELKAATALEKAGIKNFEEEYRFCERRWRFDFAFVEEKIALEIEGGIWKGSVGGHTSGTGYTKDCEKYNTATGMGWRVLRVVSSQIKSGEMVNWVRDLLGYSTEEDPFPVDNPIEII